MLQKNYDNFPYSGIQKMFTSPSHFPEEDQVKRSEIFNKKKPFESGALAVIFYQLAYYAISIRRM